MAQSSTPASPSVTKTISDLRRMAEERRQQRKSSPMRANLSSSGLERPASRAEIHALEHELEERVRFVLDTNYSSQGEQEFGTMGLLYEPHREQLLIAKQRILQELGAQSQDLPREPWLDPFLKCSHLLQMCSDVSSQLSDILGVNSAELGNVARKLRLTYQQSFEQILRSWKSLRHAYVQREEQVQVLRQQVQELQQQLLQKEEDVRQRYDEEVSRLNQEFNIERQRDADKLQQAELKMDQMADTLKYLNGIFRHMQMETTGVKIADLQAQLRRLEVENTEYKQATNAYEDAKVQLAQVYQHNKQLEVTVKAQQQEIDRYTIQLQRREEVIHQLMERETIRNAEIEKLTKLVKYKEEEILAVDMKDPATSLLCIKCKRSLDDLSNIKAAILGEDNYPQKVKIQCLAFRILLPNLKGKKPHRTLPWIRACGRGILLTKMKQDMSLLGVKSFISRFPSFVYAWFQRAAEGITGSQYTKLLVQADEDRWGFYYGIKAHGKEDSECGLLYSLLDEQFGQDGMMFCCYCLSVVLSLAGDPLWRQFGVYFIHGTSINDKPNEAIYPIQAMLWVEVAVAKQATESILKKALGPHLAAALEAIDALKVKPKDEDFLFLMQSQNPTTTTDDQENTNAAVSEDPFPLPSTQQFAHAPPATAITLAPATYNQQQEATHINLFIWLRLMLQQLQADQIHRNSAIRLMFETASVGAMTPNVSSSKQSNGSSGPPPASAGSTIPSHVEYPQFQSICQTLFPYLSTTLIADLYCVCHRHGQQKVTPDIFTHEADVRGYFSAALKLPILPLLRNIQAIAPQVLLNAERERDLPSLAINPAVMTETGGSVDKKAEEGMVTSGVSANDGSGTKDTAVAVDKGVEVSNNSGQRPQSQQPSAVVDVVNNYYGFTKKTSLILRSKLGTMLHRKFLVITPILQYLSKQFPEHWQNLLHDLLQQMTTTLQESHQKLKELLTEQLSQTYATDTPVTSQEEITHYVDGLQPYLVYRRLLSVALLMKTCNENPFLPTEIFSSLELRNNIRSIRLSLARAESIISHLEDALIIPYYSTKQVQQLSKAYFRLDVVRKLLIARKIQQSVRRFLNRDVPIPRTVRYYLASGYLGAGYRLVATGHSSAPYLNPQNTGSATNTPASVSQKERNAMPQLPLKLREVYYEPWWAQVHVGEIYFFKYLYDMHALALGTSRLPLAQAVVSYFYALWGAIDIAERMAHDLFVAIKTYRFAVPRLRLFAAFVGDPRDVDEALAPILSTPTAFQVFMQLLKDVHYFVQMHKSRMYQRAYETMDERTKQKWELLQPASQLSGQEIFMLFPANEDWFRRSDKREVWYVDVEILLAVTRVFTQRQTWLRGNQQSVYIDIVEKLRSDARRAEVDDYLYIMMMQWAKLTHWHFQRARHQSQVLETYAFTPKTKISGLESRPFTDGAGAGQKPGDATKTTGETDGSGAGKVQLLRRISMLPMSNLRTIVESVYRTAENHETADTYHYAAAYLYCLRSRRAPAALNAESAAQDFSVADLATATRQQLASDRLLSGFSGGNHHHQQLIKREFDKLLQECILWDVNIPIFTSSQLPLPPPARGSGGATPSSPDPSRRKLVEKASGSSLPSSRGQLVQTSFVDRSFAHSQRVLAAQQQCQQLIMMPVLYGTAPEVQFQALKLGFAAYQSPLNALLNWITDEPALSEDMEVRQRIQSIRIFTLSLSEFFQQTEMTPLSPRLDMLEMLGVIDEDLYQLKDQQQQYFGMVMEAKSKISGLMSAVSELALMTNQEFPRDAWFQGVKVHMDRATVYTIHTRSSFDMASAAPRPRNRQDETLAVILRSLLGQLLVIELKNDEEVAGQLAECDQHMNLLLLAAKVTNCGGSQDVEQVRIAGSRIRYVHIPPQVNIRQAVSAHEYTQSRLRRTAQPRKLVDRKRKRLDEAKEDIILDRYSQQRSDEEQFEGEEGLDEGLEESREGEQDEGECQAHQTEGNNVEEEC